MTVLTIALIFVSIVGAIAAGNLNTKLRIETRRADRKEAQANESMAHASQVERDNNDLRKRLGEQGKAWAARLKKAERR